MLFPVFSYLYIWVASGRKSICCNEKIPYTYILIEIAMSISWGLIAYMYTGILQDIYMTNTW
jgi:prepilin signal peptidase PulO-like enzyme (type II secretory pathway)